MQFYSSIGTATAGSDITENVSFMSFTIDDPVKGGYNYLIDSDSETVAASYGGRCQ